MLNEKFRTDIEAKVAAAKVFCISNRILNNKMFDFGMNRFDESKISQIKNVELPEPFDRINRLKPVLPEAFYYVWQGINE